MTQKERYTARLIFAARFPGIFTWPEESHSWNLPIGKSATLRARGASELKNAKEFHIDVDGFECPNEAREAGEKLRDSLRLANAILGFGLLIPTSDAETPRARLAPNIREQISADHGISIVDCVFGLNVLREGAEAEFVMKGDLVVRAKDSGYILESTSQLWGVSNRLDGLSTMAVELLNSAVRDPSYTSRFLITYLALDIVLQRRKRSGKVLQVVKELIALVDTSLLESREKRALRSYLGGWKTTSLRTEIERLANHGNNGEVLLGNEPLPVFLDACRKLRNRLSHPPADATTWGRLELEAQSRAKELRSVVLNVIWARNKLPDFKVVLPGDSVQVEKMTITIL